MVCERLACLPPCVARHGTCFPFPPMSLSQCVSDRCRCPLEPIPAEAEMAPALHPYERPLVAPPFGNTRDIETILLYHQDPFRAYGCPFNDQVGNPPAAVTSDNCASLLPWRVVRVVRTLSEEGPQEKVSWVPEPICLSKRSWIMKSAKSSRPNSERSSRKKGWRH